MIPEAGLPYYVKYPSFQGDIHACYCQGVTVDDQNWDDGGVFNVPGYGLQHIGEDDVISEVHMGHVHPPSVATDPAAPVLPPQPALVQPSAMEIPLVQLPPPVRRQPTTPVDEDDEELLATPEPPRRLSLWERLSGRRASSHDSHPLS